MTTTLRIPKPISWPPAEINNEFGIATLSLGDWRQHKLEPRLRAAANAGYKCIDLFDECWAAYLEENGLNGGDEHLWEATPDKLKVAKKLGTLVKTLGMRIACTQPLRKIEGIKNVNERWATLGLVAKRFPFMRAFDTDLVFMCASIRNDPGVTSDLQTVAADLRELGDMAMAYSKENGGPVIKIGYEGLSWATRNTWSSSWEVVRTANRCNVGLVVDAFNVLAVEWADPYNPAGHGRIYSTLEESVELLCSSLASMVASVPGDKIFFFQIGDAELVEPKLLREALQDMDPDTPKLLPWSRGHRLYPYEHSKGGYMPAQLVAAAVIATGYRGPLSLEVFNDSLNIPGDEVPMVHAQRGIIGLKKMIDAIPSFPAFWDSSQDVSISELVRIVEGGMDAKPNSQ